MRHQLAFSGWFCLFLAVLSLITKPATTHNTTDRDSHGQRSTSIESHYSIGRSLSSARSSIDLSPELRNRTTRSPQQGQMVDRDIRYSLLTPSPSSRSSTQHRNYQQRCLSSLQAFQSKQPQSVTLLRISPQSLDASAFIPPFTFNVDSTIGKLTVLVNGSNPSDTTIGDPTGTILSSRVRRAALNPSTNPTTDLTRESPRQARIKITAGPEEDLLQSPNDFQQTQWKPPQKQKRLRRTAALMSMQVFENVAIWEVEPPQSGTWSIIVDGPEPVQVLVTALSNLDFRYDLLDVRTMERLITPPVAYDTSLVKITLSNPACVSKAVLLNLVDEAGVTLADIAIDNVGVSQGQVNDDGRNNILVWFQTPSVPFYIAVTGYDIQDLAFQRLSPARVIPRMFAVSLADSNTGPLVPGNDYKFVVHLRNTGQTDMFKIDVTWDNNDYIKATVAPDVLRVGLYQNSHTTVLVTIQPSISFFMKGLLTISATRISDNVTDTLTHAITAEPRSFLEDDESPTCSIISLSGGCRPTIPCYFQKWAVSVSVIDSLTGVRSATLLHPPHGAYTNIQFFYSMRNRTTHVDYGYNCCNVEITLLAYDFANNPCYCSLHAPMLGTATASSLPSDTSNTSQTARLPTPPVTITQSPAPISQDKNPSSSQQPFSSKETSTVVSTDLKSSKITGQNFSTTAVAGIAESTRLHSSRAANRVTSILLPTQWRKKSTQPPQGSATTHLNSTTQLNTNLYGQQKFDVSKLNNLKLAAIICGSISGAAALGIIVLCVVYRYLHKGRRSHPRRQGSNGSDITMGSSLESRSEDSSVTDSVRMSKLAEKEDRVWRSQGSYDSPDQLQDGYKKNRGIYESGQRPHSFYTEQITAQYEHHSRHQRNSVDGRDRMSQARNREEVEDVTFSCVFVKVCDREDSHTNSSRNDASREEFRKASYSPLLKAGGRTFTSMLHVQRQIEEMDRQRQLLSVAVNDENATRRLSVRHDEIRAQMDEKAKPLKRMAFYRDSPPGSPQMAQDSNNPQPTELSENRDAKADNLQGTESEKLQRERRNLALRVVRESDQQSARIKVTDQTGKAVCNTCPDSRNLHGSVCLHNKCDTSVSLSSSTDNSTRTKFKYLEQSLYGDGSSFPATTELQSPVVEQQYGESSMSVRTSRSRSARELAPASELRRALPSPSSKNSAGARETYDVATEDEIYYGAAAGSEDTKEDTDLSYMSQTSDRRLDTEDPRLFQQTRVPVVISDASQMALRLDIEHIRQKLLKFQRRIDNEIDEGVRRSCDHSPSSSGNYSVSEDG